MDADDGYNPLPRATSRIRSDGYDDAPHVPDPARGRQIFLTVCALLIFLVVGALIASIVNTVSTAAVASSEHTLVERFARLSGFVVDETHRRSFRVAYDSLDAATSVTPYHMLFGLPSNGALIVLHGWLDLAPGAHSVRFNVTLHLPNASGVLSALELVALHLDGDAASYSSVAVLCGGPTTVTACNQSVVAGTISTTAPVASDSTDSFLLFHMHDADVAAPPRSHQLLPTDVRYVVAL